MRDKIASTQATARVLAGLIATDKPVGDASRLAA